MYSTGAMAARADDQVTQVRHHCLSRKFVLTLMRRSRGSRDEQLTGLAERLNVA